MAAEDPGLGVAEGRGAGEPATSATWRSPGPWTRNTASIEQAMKAARQWKFKPGTKDGQAGGRPGHHRADLHAEIGGFSATLGEELGLRQLVSNSPEVAVMAHNGQRLRGLLVTAVPR